MSNIDLQIYSIQWYPRFLTVIVYYSIGIIYEAIFRLLYILPIWFCVILRGRDIHTEHLHWAIARNVLNSGKTGSNLRTCFVSAKYIKKQQQQQQTPITIKNLPCRRVRKNKRPYEKKRETIIERYVLYCIHSPYIYSRCWHFLLLCFNGSLYIFF